MDYLVKSSYYNQQSTTSITSDELFWRELSHDFDYNAFVAQFNRQDISSATTHAIAINLLCDEIKHGSVGIPYVENNTFGGIFKLQIDNDGIL